MERVRPAKKPLFLSMFSSFVLCIAIIVAISSTMFYINIENTMSSQISKANLESLNQISDEVNSIARMSSTISYQIYNDVTISKLLYFSNLNIYDQSLAMSQIANYRMIFPIIESIYVYNGTSDEFYVRSNNFNDSYGLTKDRFYDKQAVLIIEHHKEYKPSVPVARKYVDADGNVQSLYTFIMYNDLWSANNAVIVNINENNMQSIIDNGQGGGESFIMDGRGVIVSNSGGYPMLTDVSGEDFVRHIKDNQDAPGYFVTDVKGTKSLIVYTVPDSLGWTYVRVFPWNGLFSTVSRIKIIVIVFSLAIMALGVVSAFIITRQLYRPIHGLISRVRNLEEEKKDSTSVMKQELLREILSGSVSESTQDLKTRHDDLGVNIPFDRPVILMLLKIDRMKSFLQQYNAEERDAIKKSILRIASEKLSAWFRLEAVDTGEDSLAFILDGAGTADTGRQGLKDRLSAVQAEILARLNISVSAAVSVTGGNAEMMHELYDQAQKALQHRLFCGHGCVIFAEDIMAYSSKGYNYPAQKEKLLIDSLMENRIADAKKICSEIVGETASYPIGVFNLAISHLIYTLNSTINTIISNHSASGGLDEGIPVGLLSETETIEEFNASIYDILDRLNRLLEEKKTQKHELIVRSINDIIQSRFAASNLSISTIADILGVSEAYICRVYKQLTLHTILESIVEVRMKHARELLQKTEYSVSQIAEKCGFSNSTYFYTAFKAANGVTPSDYRKIVHGEAEAGLRSSQSL